MPAAEIGAALTGIRASLDIAKAMVNLRDAESFRAKSIELQTVVLDTLEKAILAREAQTELGDRIRALEAEVAHLKSWDAEKQNYELKKSGDASVAYMLKPDRRGSEPPHWLCPNCFSKGQKSFLNPASSSLNVGRGHAYNCGNCKAVSACYMMPSWDQAK
jgi:hypothetical protein